MESLESYQGFALLLFSFSVVKTITTLILTIFWDQEMAGRIIDINILTQDLNIMSIKL